MSNLLRPALLAVALIQEGPSLVIVVRDSAGTPLAGIALDILLAGPPHEPYTVCVTDATGRCDLQVPPGLYVIQFVGGWEGQDFIPAARQNSGALDDGAAGNGFGVYVEEYVASPVITFVVVTGLDGLLPLWDTSRDSELTPQPFFPPGTTSESVDMAPLLPESSGSTPTPQVVTGAYALYPPPTQPAAIQPVVDGDGGNTPTLGADLVLLGLVAATLVALAVATRRPGNKRDGKGKGHG